MKKNLFIALFITTHIGFLFLHIHKHMEFIRESFAKQRNEQQLAQAQQEKQAKENELYALSNKQQIKKEAHEKLGLAPAALTQMHRLSHG